jgi:uncharacterized protein (UPF0261 family)
MSNTHSGPILIVGTGDTKREELEFLRDRVTASGMRAVTVDVGIRSSGEGADFGPRDVASHHPQNGAILEGDDRGEAVTAMGDALIAFFNRQAHIGGVLGFGGSGGTAIIAPAMQSLAIGIPKVLVSTLASGDVRPYVGPTDICMMYSVTDLAGLNRISKEILANAAGAICGMAAREAVAQTQRKPAVGITMFGVTTPLVTELVRRLAGDFDPLVFHATGTGGQSLEKLVETGEFHAVLDTTTTEIADHLFGGVLSAGPGRLDAIAWSEVPYVGSCGALDMVNFGPKETVPERYRERLLYEHNPFVTLMRTSLEENEIMGAWIAEKLNRCQGPVRFLLPTEGVSMIDALGMPFHDLAADEVLFRTIEREVETTPNRRVTRVPHHINDSQFADAIQDALREVTP